MCPTQSHPSEHRSTRIVVADRHSAAHTTQAPADPSCAYGGGGMYVVAPEQAVRNISNKILLLLITSFRSTVELPRLELGRDPLIGVRAALLKTNRTVQVISVRRLSVGA
jgi:hypothetical protein